MDRIFSHPLIELRTSSIHHKGMFAKTFIPLDARIIEYIGEKITPKESDRRGNQLLKESQQSKTRGSVYIFQLNKRYDIDGDVPWNWARFINHSCEPNAEAVNIRGRIFISALRNINPDEEILYNYGYDITDYEDHPCRCGTKRCVGYILDEDHWPKLQFIKKSSSQ